MNLSYLLGGKFDKKRKEDRIKPKHIYNTLQLLT
jgi:hypothetical protein